jgi:predicted dehydrogenase
MDLGVQTIDLALWMLGFPRIESIFTHLHRPPGYEVEDTAAVLIRLADGGCVSLTVSWSLVADRDRHYLRLLGTRGSGAITPLAVYKELETGMIDVTPQLPGHRENLYTISYRNELSHFLRICGGHAEVPPLPREQVELMRLVALAYRSAEEKREIPVTEE